jgi:hypothetical protein
LGLFFTNIFPHHGLNYYHQFFHACGVLFFLLFGFVLLLGPEFLGLTHSLHAK